MNYSRVYGYLFSSWLLSALWSCTTQPYSNWQIYTPADDHLSNRQKISIIENSYPQQSALTLATAARLYAGEGNMDKALSAVNKAITLDPLNSSLHTLKANYTYAVGKPSTAYTEALTAYRLGVKSLQQSLELARMAVALSEFSIAGGIIDSLLVAYPEKPDVLYLAARKYDQEENHQQARACYQKALSFSPGNQEIAYHYGRFLQQLGESLNAREVLATAAANSPGKSYLLLQGDIYRQTNQPDSAARKYRQALAIQPDTATFNKLLTMYHGNTDSLINISRRALAAYPDNRQYLLLAARSLDKRYRYEQALGYYLKLYQKDTLDSMVVAEMSYLQRKIAYLQRKQREQQKLADSLSKVLPVIIF